jgi:predicted transcriptional regulator
MDELFKAEKKRCIITTKPSSLPNKSYDGESVFFVYDSFEDALVVATECRLTLLKIIREKNPDSLYELALLVGKNQAYVYREAKTLQECGFIKLEQLEGVGRKKVRPVSLFDEILLWF